VTKNRTKKIFVIAFFLLAFALFGARFALAQNFGLEAVNNGLAGSLSADDPRTIAGRIINISLGVLGVIAVGFVIFGGVIWMTSGGEEEKISRAKKILKNGVIGLVIIIASWAIATFVLSKLGGGSGGGWGCIDGDISPCGCGGYMVCEDGSWGACIGSDCSGNGPASCDVSPNPGCQAENNICAPSDFCDAADCGCKPKGQMGDPCDADINTPTCEADNNRCSEYLTCNVDTCTCYGPPVILDVSPAGGFCEDNPNQPCATDSDCALTCNLDSPNGAPDNLLTIAGKNFGAYASSSSQVVFLGSSSPTLGRQPTEINPACVDSWTDSQIIIVVPRIAEAGAIQVVNADGLSDSTNDGYGPGLPDFQANSIIRPGLCLLNPASGYLQSEVAYEGSNLYDSNAYFGNYQSNVPGLNPVFNNPLGLSGTALTPNIESGQSGSFVINNISGYAQKSNYLKFLKEVEQGEGPFISSFSPTSGPAGQYVTIRGQGFGGARGLSRVFFGSMEADYDFPDVCLDSVWRDDQVVVKVPAGLPDGNYVISLDLVETIISTEELNPSIFEADSQASLKTSLCKISPERGPISTPVSLWGEYFGPIDAEGLVKFNYDRSAYGTIAQDGQAERIDTAVPAESISGPVRVIKGGQWGNELNFEVGACQVDADCGGQVCCPATTYKKGRCVNSLNECLIDIPTSVFEWSFSTGFENPTSTEFYSCAGLANYLGACQNGVSCPNVPGVCSPYAGGGKQVVDDCDYSCASVPGCGEFGPNNCSYDAPLDRCLKNGSGSACDLPQTMTYVLGSQTFTAEKTCNQDQHWQIVVPTSCPAGWVRGSGDICVDLNSNCLICSSEFSCQSVANSGRCVSAEICPSDSICEDNPAPAQPDSCVVFDQASCDCCCSIGQDEQDCCAPLVCGGTCGTDTVDDGAGLGFCSGCAAVGSTTEEHDAACNCIGHSGQYCDISADHPEGVCVDCSSLSGKQSCNDHSAACCFDANRSSNPDDDFCRGGDGQEITVNPSDPNYGYCAYFNCQEEPADPSLCASTTPLVLGFYNSQEKCDQGCAANSGNSYCSLFDGNQAGCLAEASCCFDQASSQCLGGDRIAAGPYEGFCAYYDCSLLNPLVCDPTATTTGQFSNFATCEYNCANPAGGAGLTCAGQSSTSTCEFSSCNFPGFGCLNEDGSLGAYPECGTCCCQPGLTPDSCVTPDTPNLYCQPNQGNCSGAGRGLCCGCTQDSDCGNNATVGCGGDTCCQARPEISSTIPEHLSDNICRNAAIYVNFNQTMDVASFGANVMLLEERDYGNGVCPPGTFITQADNLLAKSNQGWLSRFYSRLSSYFKSLAKAWRGQAQADVPDPDKLYCAIPGSVASQQSGNTTSLIFSPARLLSADSNYYLLVKGDENLDSQTGVMSAASIGFNGPGYLDPNSGNYVEGQLIELNGRNYPNSQIIKFHTLPDQGPLAGLCDIDYVGLAPESYLFKTSENDLNENDGNPAHPSFDTAADRDKVFWSRAYSSDGQILAPVTGYFWDWSWSADASVASLSSINGLPANGIIATAVSGVTDANTPLTAKLDMNRFLDTNSCDSSPSCLCSGGDCPENCCNVYSTGDGEEKSGEIFIFICNNPWPPANPDGSWSPWQDNCLGAFGPCAEYNYNFYYCRDAGDPTTLDDLPAIIDQAVIRGQSENLACTSDRSPCANLGGACGQDQNGDGQADGVCLWNILKESYFFRAELPQAGELLSAVDTQIGGAVTLAWRSSASQVDKYNLYYVRAGQGNMQSVSVLPADVCSLISGVYNCSATLSGLENGYSYVFKVTVLSANKTESDLSNEKTATPTDKTAPAVPTNLSVDDNPSSQDIKFTWTPVVGALYYRLYHGIASGLYGESFDSGQNASSLSFSRSQFSSGTHYFRLSALDASGNESGQSSPEVQLIVD